MDTTSTGPQPGDLTLDQLKAMLREDDPGRRIEALRVLGRRRGANVIRLIDTCSNDSSGEVRRVAGEMRAIAEAETALFGPGEALRIELPAPLETPEERARTIRLMWVAWGIGGFLAITALLVQEHTGLIWAPLVGVAVVMLLVIRFTMRLMNPPARVTWLRVDPAARTLVLEPSPPDGASEYPFSSIKALRRQRRIVPGGEDERPREFWELELELADGNRLVVARREEAGELERATDRLGAHLGHPLSSD
jgi:hypothetical protein